MAKIIILLLLNAVNAQLYCINNKFGDLVAIQLDITSINIDIDEPFNRITRLNGLRNVINKQEFEFIYILELKFRVTSLITAHTHFIVSNGIDALLLQRLSSILIISLSESEACNRWRNLRVEKENNSMPNIMRSLLEIPDFDISVLYTLTQDYIKKEKVTIINDLLIRILNIHQSNDSYEIKQDNNRNRSLDELRKNGLVFRYDGDKIDLLKEIKMSEIPLVEQIKNERLLTINGFKGSKISLMIHDCFDHFWTYDFLDKEGIFQRYQSFFDQVGNPHKTDMFKREGELIASIVFEYRFAHLSKNVDPYISFEDITTLFENNILTGNLQRAYDILLNKKQDEQFKNYLAQVISGIYTELMEQRRKHGFIRIVANQDALLTLDLEYLALIIEVYALFDANREKAFQALLTIALILENYLESLRKSYESKEITVTLEDIRQFIPSQTNLSKSCIQWFKDNLQSLSNRAHMKTEFEAKFFPISKDIFRKLLKKNGGLLQQKEILMKRVIYQLGDKQLKKWLRVRDEGSKTTITIKEIINPNAIDGIREIEINTDDFQKTRHLFDSMGLTLKSYQENYREIWDLNGAIITIDTWPGLDTILEIESDSAEHVKGIINMLNLDEEDALYGAVDTFYQMKHGISPYKFNSIQNISFDTIDSILHQLKKESS